MNDKFSSIEDKFSAFDDKFNTMGDKLSTLDNIKEHLGMKEAVHDEPSS